MLFKFTPAILGMAVVLAIGRAEVGTLATDGSAKSRLEWVEFAGRATTAGARVTLSGGSGGEVEMDSKDVRTEGGRVLVRNNSPATIKAPPGGGQKSACAKQDDCPSKCCACIGLVRVCCGEGGTRGVCFGVWGCP